MYQYIVVSDRLNDTDIQSATTDMFKVYENVWIVRAEHNTCADMCVALSIDTHNQKWGIVAPFNTFYGFFDPALWQKVEAWWMLP